MCLQCGCIAPIDIAEWIKHGAMRSHFNLPLTRIHAVNLNYRLKRLNLE